MGKLLKLDKGWTPKKETIVRDYGDSAEVSSTRTVRSEKVIQTVQGKHEVKSIVSGTSSFYDYLTGSQAQNLAAFQALAYYANVSVVYDALDDIITPAKVIQPVLFNDKKNEWITEHPLLELLKNPGGGMSGELFRSFWLLNKLAVGTSFMIATGFKENPPLELLMGYGQDMTLQSDSNGYLQKVFQSSISDMEFYTRDDDAKGNTFRYFTKDDQKELHISRTANVRFSGTNQWGLSPLKPLMIEIEQFISQNVHNDSVLKRGATPSLLFSAEKELTDDQYTKLNDSILSYYQGAANAGQPLIGENGMTVSNLSQTNKDMEYDNMVKSLSARVYNIYNIPLPSVMSGTMTMSNLEASRLIKYDDAILPAVDDMYSELSRLLVHRYKDLEGYRLTYDPATIEALEPRRLANAQVVNKLELLSTDEQRTTYLKREPIGGAGEDILVSANKLPLGRDKLTDDQGGEGVKPAKKPTGVLEVLPEDDGSTLLEEETDMAKFIRVVKNKMGLTNDQALSAAIEQDMIKSTSQFIEEVKRLKKLNHAEAMVVALDFDLIKVDK